MELHPQEPRMIMIMIIICYAKPHREYIYTQKVNILAINV